MRSISTGGMADCRRNRCKECVSKDYHARKAARLKSQAQAA